MEQPIDAPKCISQKGISVSILIDNEELDLYVLNDEMNIVCQVNQAYRIKVICLPQFITLLTFSRSKMTTTRRFWLLHVLMVLKVNVSVFFKQHASYGGSVSPYLRIVGPRSETQFVGFYKDGGRAISEFMFSPIKKVLTQKASNAQHI
jgi:hypothetical protein